MSMEYDTIAYVICDNGNCSERECVDGYPFESEQYQNSKRNGWHFDDERTLNSYCPACSKALGLKPGTASENEADERETT